MGCRASVSKRDQLHPLFGKYYWATSTLRDVDGNESSNDKGTAYLLSFQVGGGRHGSSSSSSSSILKMTSTLYHGELTRTDPTSTLTFGEALTKYSSLPVEQRRADPIHCSGYQFDVQQLSSQTLSYVMDSYDEDARRLQMKRAHGASGWRKAILTIHDVNAQRWQLEEYRGDGSTFCLRTVEMQALPWFATELDAVRASRLFFLQEEQPTEALRVAAAQWLLDLKHAEALASDAMTRTGPHASSSLSPPAPVSAVAVATEGLFHPLFLSPFLRLVANRRGRSTLTQLVSPTEGPLQLWLALLMPDDVLTPIGTKPVFQRDGSLLCRILAEDSTATQSSSSSTHQAAATTTSPLHIVLQSHYCYASVTCSLQEVVLVDQVVPELGDEVCDDETNEEVFYGEPYEAGNVKGGGESTRYSFDYALTELYARYSIGAPHRKWHVASPLAIHEVRLQVSPDARETPEQVVTFQPPLLIDPVTSSQCVLALQHHREDHPQNTCWMLYDR